MSLIKTLSETETLLNNRGVSLLSKDREKKHKKNMKSSPRIGRDPLATMLYENRVKYSINKIVDASNNNLPKFSYNKVNPELLGKTEQLKNKKLFFSNKPLNQLTDVIRINPQKDIHIPLDLKQIISDTFASLVVNPYPEENKDLEMITNLDILLTIANNLQFTKQNLLISFYKMGHLNNADLVVDMSNAYNPHKITYIGELYGLSRIQSPKIAYKTSINEDANSLPFYKQQTRQEIPDGTITKDFSTKEMICKPTYATDIKFGNMKKYLDGRNTTIFINPNNEKNMFNGILNEPVPFDVFMKKRDLCYTAILRQCDNAQIIKFIMEAKSLLHDKNIPLTQKCNALPSIEDKIQEIIELGGLRVYLNHINFISWENTIAQEKITKSCLLGKMNVLDSWKTRYAAYQQIIRDHTNLYNNVKQLENTEWAISCLKSFTK